MQVVTEFPFAIVEEEDVGIVMPDGCRLSARIWRAEGAGPVPAILEYIPYRKRDGTLARDERMHPYFAGHGYAAVRVDMRGNGDSEGIMTDEYTPQELQDACDVIAWLAEQPWCSGAVGMMGKSWGGFNCLQTAALQPPALKAVVSVCSTTDRFGDDIHFKGGCLLNENLGWGAVMLSYSSRPADPVLRPDWREDWLARLEADAFLSPRWAAHQARDAYWKHGSVGQDYGALKAKVLSFGGWADGYKNTVAHLVENVPGTKGIVGPWVHQYPHQAVPGPAIGFLQVALRWWDRWLKGIENGAEDDPAYRVWMMDSEPPNAAPTHRAGVWVAEAAFPPPRGQALEFTLTKGGGLAEHPGRSEAALGVNVCTKQHLGLSAGEYFPMGLNAEMPGDQRADDALSVCFDGDILAEPLALLGAARLRLRLSSDKPLAFIVARLCDVGPDGASTRIAHGMLNLCHRNGPDAPEQLVPGQEVSAEVVLDQMAYRVAAGHHLRLALSTSYWPFLWPSPEIATLTLAEGQLQLPLHPGAGADEWQPPAAEAAREWRHKKHGEGRAARRVEQDQITGEISLVVTDDSGLVENLTHGLMTADRLAERWTIHPDDPTRARGYCEWEQWLSRGDWAVRTLVSAEMYADGPDLVMRAHLRAFEGEAVVFSRDFQETVPRRFI
ncbi:MAG: CocE/NonD family hydrolase [Pseudorhodobacter sp.]|nr:CocE/NonD family hydrolase [Pseudorhodobacter sp.]